MGVALLGVLSKVASAMYAGVVLLLIARGAANGIIGASVVAYIVVYIIVRIVHSWVPISGLHPNFRVACLGVQFVCPLGLIAYGVR